MPKAKIRTKSWPQVWKNSPDSTYDATPPSRDTLAKQYAKQAAHDIESGKLTMAEADDQLQRVQGK